MPETAMVSGWRGIMPLTNILHPPHFSD